MSIKILAFAGSTRVGSYNKMLVRNAAQLAEKKGAEVTVIDLRDYPMPLYDGDLEQLEGVPENALRLRGAMCAAHGILLSCPEYNSAISAVLKNAIDWVSRPVAGEPALAAFTGKTVALLATSPGALGGLRTLASVRAILGTLGMIVLPRQFALSGAAHRFDEHGKLTDESELQKVASVVEQLVSVTESLHRN